MEANIFVYSLHFDCSTEGSLRDADLGIRVDVGTFAAEVIAPRDTESNEKFLLADGHSYSLPILNTYKKTNGFCNNRVEN